MSQTLGASLGLVAEVDAQQTSESILSQINHLSPSADDFAIRVVDLLLELADVTRASDVHLQPTGEGLAVSLRVDGVLRPTVRIARGATDPVSRLKVLAGLLTYQTTRPQEGRLPRGTGQREARLSVFPSLFGERGVIRLMDPRSDLRTIGELGLPAAVAEELSEVVHQRDGAILMTGPAGSGKTTTLYAALREIVSKSQGGRAVLTIEDPIESILEGVSQSRLDPSAGFDTPTALRSMLRQDAEVLLVGEIRDPDSAEAVLRAALTGHLVFSSLHAGDVATALRRLQELGLPAFLIRSGIRAIFSQRLLRRLCLACRSEVPSASEIRRATWRSVGCDKCFCTGYSGRIVVAECLRLDRGPQGDAVAAAFDRCLPSGEIYAAARQAGFVTMLDSAAKLVESGITTSEELFRVFGGGGEL